MSTSYLSMGASCCSCCSLMVWYSFSNFFSFFWLICWAAGGETTASHIWRILTNIHTMKNVNQKLSASCTSAGCQRGLNFILKIFCKQRHQIYTCSCGIRCDWFCIYSAITGANFCLTSWFTEISHKSYHLTVLLRLHAKLLQYADLSISK